MSDAATISRAAEPTPLADVIRAVVDAAPPLSGDQLAELRRLLTASP